MKRSEILKVRVDDELFNTRLVPMNRLGREGRRPPVLGWDRQAIWTRISGSNSSLPCTIGKMKDSSLIEWFSERLGDGFEQYWYAYDGNLYVDINFRKD